MIPLSLLRAAIGLPIRITNRSGDTYVGYLISCDTHMNVILKDVVFTSADASTFYQYEEIVLRGSSVRYITVENAVLEKLREMEAQEPTHQPTRHAHRGGARGGARGGRGGQRGGARGGSRPHHHNRYQHQES